MKIYTKSGDKGKTGIVGKYRVYKDDVRIECNGILDEAVSYIGLLRVKLPPEHQWQEMLYIIQSDLMNMMSHVATPSHLKEKNKIDKPKSGPEYCEKQIDSMLAEIDGPHDYFILPGGTEVSALCHIVRTSIRTAERRLITLNKEDPVEEFILKYINRLSDLFFVMSRFDIYNAGLDEEKLRPFIL